MEVLVDLAICSEDLVSPGHRIGEGQAGHPDLLQISWDHMAKPLLLELSKDEIPSPSELLHPFVVEERVEGQGSLLGPVKIRDPDRSSTGINALPTEHLQSFTKYVERVIFKDFPGDPWVSLIPSRLCRGYACAERVTPPNARPSAISVSSQDLEISGQPSPRVDFHTPGISGTTDHGEYPRERVTISPNKLKRVLGTLDQKPDLRSPPQPNCVPFTRLIGGELR